MANPKRAESTTICGEPAAIRSLAAKLAKKLLPRGVVALDGPLGAGKTEFVKGLADGIGCAEIPTSPTFAIAHEYRSPATPLFHFDFYRLESEDELETCGFEDCVGEGVVAVEWASKFEGRMPPETVFVKIEILPSGARRVRVRNSRAGS